MKIDLTEARVQVGYNALSYKDFVQYVAHTLGIGWFSVDAKVSVYRFFLVAKTIFIREKIYIRKKVVMKNRWSFLNFEIWHAEEERFSWTSYGILPTQCYMHVTSEVGMINLFDSWYEMAGLGIKEGGVKHQGCTEYTTQQSSSSINKHLWSRDVTASIID